MFKLKMCTKQIQTKIMVESDFLNVGFLAPSGFLVNIVMQESVSKSTRKYKKNADFSYTSCQKARNFRFCVKISKLSAKEA